MYGEIFYSENCWVEDEDNIRYGSKNIYAPKGIHIMNKNEKTALRKLKKETGLSEEELRKEKKYRKILSEAQKSGGPKDNYDRNLISLVKKVLKEAKLPVDHPQVRELIKDRLDHNPYWGRVWHYGTPAVNDVISRYKALRKKQKTK